MGDKGRKTNPRSTGSDDTPAVPFSCKELSFQSQLFSPKPIAAQLPPGTWLDVKLDQENGAYIALAVTSQGDEVGCIGTDSLDDLIRCLKEGNPYRAVILEPSTGGLCIVRVFHKDSLRS